MSFTTSFELKNPEQKGFNRLVKDADPAKEGESETNFLINGRRVDDLRAEKLGWNFWPWGDGLGRTIFFGVPGVKQESNAIIRNIRNQANAYNLDDTSHFIGKLRERGVMPLSPKKAE
jgi:hypothetical protein